MNEGTDKVHEVRLGLSLSCESAAGAGPPVRGRNRRSAEFSADLIGSREDFITTTTQNE